MAFIPLRPLPFAFDGLAATVALIDEQRCIGCTLCIRACPVDAIERARQRLAQRKPPGKQQRSTDRGESSQ